jgi:hypothetical protein
VLAAQGLAGLGKVARDVSRTVVRHDLPTLDVLAIEPSHSPAQVTNRRGLLLVRQHLDVGQPRGVVDGHVDTVVADASRAALLAVADDAMTDLAKAGKLFDIDMDQVSGMVPLVAQDRRRPSMRRLGACSRDWRTNAHAGPR